MKFQLGPGLTLDTEDDRVKKQGLRIANIAESGAGKSHLNALFAEQAIQQDLQLVIFDTHGEYWPFAEIFETVLVVGGDNADLPLQEEAIDIYAEAYKRGKSLDLSFKEIFTDEEIYSRMAEKLLRALWKVEVNDPRPSLWILEESQVIAPQEKTFDVLRRVNLVKNILTGGRKFGVNTILSTQRPAELNKTPLSQCWIRFFGKVTETRDQDALKKMIAPINPRLLGDLRTGQFYVYGWEDKTRLHSIFGKEKRVTRTGGDTVLLAPIQRKASSEQLSISEFKTLIEAKIAKDQLEKTEIASLKGQLTAKDRQLEELRMKANVAEVIRDSLGDTRTGTAVSVAPSLSPEILAKLETLATYEGRIGLLTSELEKSKAREAQFDESRKALRFLLSETDLVLKESSPSNGNSLKQEFVQASLEADSIKSLKPSQRQIYDYLAKFRGTYLSIPQLASALDRRPKSSVWIMDLAFLRRISLIERDGNKIRVR